MLCLLNKNSKHPFMRCLLFFAEAAGFEPTVPFSTEVFKTSGINHSPTLPSRSPTNISLAGIGAH